MSDTAAHRLFAAICIHDPEFAAKYTFEGSPGKKRLYAVDPDTEQDLHHRLMSIIVTKFRPFHTLRLNSKAAATSHTKQTTLDGKYCLRTVKEVQ